MPLQARPAQHPPGVCPACGSRHYTERFAGSDRLLGIRSATHTYLECVKCGLTRREAVNGAYDHEHLPDCIAWELTPAFYGRYADSARRLAWHNEIRFVTVCTSASHPLLDFAAPGFTMAKTLAAFGYTVVAYRTSADAVDADARAEGFSTVRGQVGAPSFLPGSFGSITAFHVLEHLQRPDAALRALHALLAPDGRLIVKIPNSDSWQALLLGPLWSGFDVPRHPLGFGPHEVRTLLEDCGFEVMRCKAASPIHDAKGLVASLFPWMAPAVRRIRGVRESWATKAWKDLLYLALTTAATPLTLLEAAGGGGACLLIEARRAGKAASDIGGDADAATSRQRPRKPRAK